MHGPNYTSNAYMLMEVDWGGNLICTSYRCTMVVDWQAHETHPAGHSISEVDWGGNDPSPNHMNGFMFSEVDCGAHDLSLFLFLVNIDYDAKPKESSIQGLWGQLEQRASSSPLIVLLIDSLATGQTEENIINSKTIDPDLDDSEQPTGESIQSNLTLVGQLQWPVSLGRFVTHAQVTTLYKVRSTQKKLQRIYGYVIKATDFCWTQSNTTPIKY